MTIKIYDDAVQKVNERIQGFQVANSEDAARLEKVKKEYEQAVNSFQDAKAEKLHDEMSVLKRNLDNRRRQIAILSKDDNPNIVQAANESILKSVESIEAVKEKGNLQLEEIEKAKENYALAVKKYRNLAREAKDHNDDINDLVAKADDETLLKIHSNPKVARLGTLNLVRMKSIKEFDIENLSEVIEKLEGGIN